MCCVPKFRLWNLEHSSSGAQAWHARKCNYGETISRSGKASTGLTEISTCPSGGLMRLENSIWPLTDLKNDYGRSSWRNHECRNDMKFALKQQVVSDVTESEWSTAVQWRESLQWTSSHSLLCTHRLIAVSRVVWFVLHAILTVAVFFPYNVSYKDAQLPCATNIGWQPDQDGDGVFMVNGDLQLLADGTILAPEEHRVAFIAKHFLDIPVPTTRKSSPVVVPELYSLLKVHLHHNTYMAALMMGGW